MTELNLPLDEQVRGFLIAAAVGVLLGALYDAARVYRILMRPPKRQVFFLDAAVICLCALLTFLTALAVSRGTLRFYLFLGEAIGWCAYAVSIGQVTVRLARALLRLLERALFRPLRRVLASLRALFLRAARSAERFLKKILNLRKKALKPRG